VKLDVDKIEAVEAGLDAFINSRSREKGEANAQEAAWAETTRRENEKRRNRDRWERIRYHAHLHQLKTQSAARHAQERDRLLIEAGCEPDNGPREAA
jgi:hypothetical protein